MKRVRLKLVSVLVPLMYLSLVLVPLSVTLFELPVCGSCRRGSAPRSAAATLDLAASMKVRLLPQVSSQFLWNV